jgi:soluble lytic murein transglycosylase-like protein
VRKVLIPALAASAAAAPAVALAATNDNQTHDSAATSAATTTTHELRTDLALKLDNAARLERKRTLRAKAHKRARARKRAAAAQGSTASPQLQAIAACESGGNPRAIGGGGAYRGKYQFDYGTWASVGGTGDPAAAPEAEQDRRAQILLHRSGTAPWPVCGS